MTAGFRYIKPGGTTAQIDNEYSNLVLREKKTFVVPLGAEWYIGTTTISGSQDSVIAFSADQFCGPLGSSQSGQTWTLVFAGRVNAPAPTVIIYSFDLAGYGQQYEFANAALEIWKPDRTKAFSSRLKYLRPIDTLSEVVPPDAAHDAGDPHLRRFGIARSGHRQPFLLQLLPANESRAAAGFHVDSNLEFGSDGFGGQARCGPIHADYRPASVRHLICTGTGSAGVGETGQPGASAPPDPVCLGHRAHATPSRTWRR